MTEQKRARGRPKKAAENPLNQYIIDGEYIEKLDAWLGEHGIDAFERMQICARLKLVPYQPHTEPPCEPKRECE
jgi:hypothetical protein